MDLAWFFIRKPKIGPHETISKHPTEKPMPSDWAWAVMIFLLAGAIAYAVHIGPDADYPGGRAPIYFWIGLGAVVFAPMLLMPSLLGRRRASALGGVVLCIIFMVGPFIMAAWPESQGIFYEPLSAKPWKAMGERTPGALWVWAFVCTIFFITAVVAVLTPDEPVHRGLAIRRHRRRRR